MGTERSATSGWRRGVVTALIVMVVASPVLRNRDSFPLSTYPVYASARGSTVTLSTAVAIDANGEARRLSLDIIARTDDPLIAESLVDGAIAGGRAEELCRDIAGRAPADSVAVEVVEERHDIVARTIGEESLLDRVVHARCELAR